MAQQAGDDVHFAGMDLSVVVSIRRAVAKLLLKDDKQFGVIPKSPFSPHEIEDLFLRELHALFGDTGDNWFGMKKKWLLKLIKGDGKCGFAARAILLGLDPVNQEGWMQGFSEMMRVEYKENLKYGTWLDIFDFLRDVLQLDANYADGIMWIRVIANYSLPDTKERASIEVRVGKLRLPDAPDGFGFEPILASGDEMLQMIKDCHAPYAALPLHRADATRPVCLRRLTGRRRARVVRAGTSCSPPRSTTPGIPSRTADTSSSSRTPSSRTRRLRPTASEGSAPVGVHARGDRYRHPQGGSLRVRGGGDEPPGGGGDELPPPPEWDSDDEVEVPVDDDSDDEMVIEGEELFDGEVAAFALPPELPPLELPIASGLRLRGGVPQTPEAAAALRGGGGGRGMGCSEWDALIDCHTWSRRLLSALMGTVWSQL